MKSITATLLVALTLSQPGYAASVDVEVLQSSGAALADAVVFLMPSNGKSGGHASKTAVIDQIDRMFVPLVSVIETGTSVTFPNKDNIRHQVYSFSPAKTFVLKLYSGVPAQPVVFDKPGLVVMGCNIHDQMVAYVQVVDTPWFGKTGADGKIRIEGFPAGEYDVHVWHFRQTGDDMIRHSVALSGESALTETLALKPAPTMDMHP